MSTINEKIESVVNGSAATNPYLNITSKLDNIVNNVSAITLNNQGVGIDQTSIELKWYGDGTSTGGTWVGEVSIISTIVSDIKTTLNTHYNDWWNGSPLNYTNRPSILKATRDIRIKIAYEDGTAQGWNEQTIQSYIDSTVIDDLKLGTSTFLDSNTSIIDNLITESETIINAFGGVVDATVENDVISALTSLQNVTSKLNTIKSNYNSWIQLELNTYGNALPFLSAYGFVQSITTSDDDLLNSIVGKLAGGLP